MLGFLMLCFTKDYEYKALRWLDPLFRGNYSPNTTALGEDKSALSLLKGKG